MSLSACNSNERPRAKQLSANVTGDERWTSANVVGQRIGLGTVCDLTAGQPWVDGTTFGIDERVDFAREPAAGTSHAAIVLVPLFAGRMLLNANTGWVNHDDAAIIGL